MPLIRHEQNTVLPHVHKKGVFTSLWKTIALSLVLALVVILLLGFYFGFGTYYNILCDKFVWHDPSYAQMTTFITSDTTNLETFMGPNVCDVMSKQIIQNARDHGYRAGYVYLDGGNVSHAIVCFQTTDAGWYFVEPQADIFLTSGELDAMVDEGFYHVENDQGHLTFPLERYVVNWYKTTADPSIQFWSN